MPTPPARLLNSYGVDSWPILPWSAGNFLAAHHQASGLLKYAYAKVSELDRNVIDGSTKIQIVSRPWGSERFTSTLFSALPSLEEIHDCWNSIGARTALAGPAR